MTLYLAGARMTHYHPVSIPYHGMALNITVQSYDGSLDFGITACRRVLSQEESYELVGYLRDALEEIRQLPSVGQPTAAADAVAAAAVPRPVQVKVKPAAKNATKPRATKARGAGEAARRMH
jgi:hypothetical protein